MPSEWDLHYARWIIEDGQPNRRIGETFVWFIVEAYADQPLALSRESTASAVPINDYRYRVVAQVKFVGERNCIVDFGLRAALSRDRLPEICQIGDFVVGDVGLDLPLCIDLLPEEEFSSLRYTWRVSRITADVTPYVSHADNPRYFFRDTSRISFTEVANTDQIKAQEYILHCREV